VRNVPLTPRFGDLPFIHVAAWTFKAVGLSTFAHRIEEWSAVQAIERLNLDGLLALWHPAASN
jgi:protease-4